MEFLKNLKIKTLKTLNQWTLTGPNSYWELYDN